MTVPRLNQGVRILLGILLAVAAVRQVFRATTWGHGSWQMTDWLIHYGHGFVRRGLGGSVIRGLSDWSGIAANQLVICLSVGVFLLLTAGLLLAGRKRFSPALLLSCVALGFPAYQESIVRKDCLLLLLLAGCLWSQSRIQSPPIRYLLVNFLAGTAIFCHEAFIFFGVPALLLPVDGRAVTSRGLLRRGVGLVPAIGCFALTVVHHGSPEVARAIHESWLPLWRQIEGAGADLSEPAASILALGWTPQQGMELTGGIWNRGIYQPICWIGVFGVSLVFALAFVRSFDHGAIRVRLLGVLGFQLLSIAPLFILGIDYGRWLFLWMVSSMIILLHGRHLSPALEGRIAAPLEIPLVSRWLDRLGKHEWVLLLFGVPVLWSLRNFLTAGPIPHHVWTWVTSH